MLPALAGWLKDRGVTLRFDQESAANLGRADGLPREDAVRGTDLVIVLGGDGTLLSAARAVNGAGTPIVAVNLGGLGFLTAIQVDALYPQLEEILAGDLKISRRQMIHCEVWRQGAMTTSYEGLNDIVLSKAEIARMTELEVRVDGSLVCVYKADGLIVATPTGSTAYSLAAGGPIVFPSVSAVAITPICPHTLTLRPLIVSDDAVIEVTALGGDHTTYLTIDGQTGELLQHGDRVVCRKSDQSVELVRPPNMVFFDVLREKLKWGGR